MHTPVRKYAAPKVTLCSLQEALEAGCGGKSSSFQRAMTVAIAGHMKTPQESAKVRFRDKKRAVKFQQIIYRYAPPRNVRIKANRKGCTVYVTVLELLPRDLKQV
jgi:hypothetical protein